MGWLFAKPEPSAEQSSNSSEVPASAEDAARVDAAQEKAARRQKKRADRKLCLDALPQVVHHHSNFEAECSLDRRHSGDVLRSQRKTGADKERRIVASPRPLMAVHRKVLMSDDERLALRQAESIPILRRMGAWMNVDGEGVLSKKALPDGVMPRSSAGKAVRYVLNNWKFIGSEPAGHRMAVLFTIMANAKRHHLESFA